MLHGLKSASQCFRQDLERLSKKYRCGTLKDALAILASCCVVTFILRIILALPLQSALISCPLESLYNPLLIRFPDAFHPEGFSPNVGRVSASKKLAFEV